MANDYIRKKQVKQRLSAILRDETTSTELFLQALAKAAPLFPEWNRRRKQRKDFDVNDLVQRIEAKGKGIQ